MADDRDSGALTLLTIVSAVAAVGFAVVMFGVASGSDGASVIFGLGGVCVGVLLTSTWHMYRQRRRTEREPEGAAGLIERLQVLEQDQQRVAELEERVDFAERMLARAQAEAPLLESRRMPGSGT